MRIELEISTLFTISQSLALVKKTERSTGLQGILGVHTGVKMDSSEWSEVPTTSVSSQVVSTPIQKIPGQERRDTILLMRRGKTQGTKMRSIMDLLQTLFSMNQMSKGALLLTSQKS